jgi:hypothetical protein
MSCSARGDDTSVTTESTTWAAAAPIVRREANKNDMSEVLSWPRRTMTIHLYLARVPNHNSTSDEAERRRFCIRHVDYPITPASASLTLNPIPYIVLLTEPSPKDPT